MPVDLGRCRRPRREVHGRTLVGLVVVDDDDVAHVGQVTGDRRVRSRRLRWTIRTRGTRVVELVAEVLALVRGVDGYCDEAAAHGAPPRQHRLGGVLEQRGHPLTRRRRRVPARPLAIRQARSLHLGGGERGPADVEVLAVGIGLEARLEERGDGVLVVADPPCSAHAAPAPCAPKARVIISWRSASGSRSGACGVVARVAGSTSWYAAMRPLNIRLSAAGSPLRKWPARWPRANRSACSSSASSSCAAMVSSNGAAPVRAEDVTRVPEVQPTEVGIAAEELDLERHHLGGGRPSRTRRPGRSPGARA